MSALHSSLSIRRVLNLSSRPGQRSALMSGQRLVRFPPAAQVSRRSAVEQDGHVAIRRAADRPRLAATVRSFLTGRHQQDARSRRSEEHTSELQSLMRISYAVFCLKKKKIK